jgi:predicted O-methyltransferase YrrM
MSLKDRVRRRTPEFALTSYRELATWSGVLRSPNRRFLRFAKPGHFYSPIPDLEAVESHAARVFDRSHDQPLGIDMNERGQLGLVSQFAEVHDELPFPVNAAATSRYHLDNEWFSYGDGVALYSMMRVFRPKRIIEVGSGFSSAAMLDVDERFFDGRMRLTFIEPHPERLIDLLTSSDAQRCRLIAARVQDVPENEFASLQAGDFLFIDSSHVAKIDSDVLHLLFRVLPQLRPGVLVHVHDIPWPFEYPRVWFDQGRAWNEAYFVRSFLQYNAAFEIVYFAAYLEAEHHDLMARAIPTALGRPAEPTTLGNSSLWLRKTGP